MVTDVDLGREIDAALEEIRGIQEAVGLTIVETVAQVLQHILTGLGHFTPEIFRQGADLGDEGLHALELVALAGHGGHLEGRLVPEGRQESCELVDEFRQLVHDFAIGDAVYQSGDVFVFVHCVYPPVVGIRQ